MAVVQRAIPHRGVAAMVVLGVVVVNGGPDAVAAAVVLVVVAAVWHLGERAHPVDEATIGHTALTDHAAGTCGQRGATSAPKKTTTNKKNRISASLLFFLARSLLFVETAVWVNVATSHDVKFYLWAWSRWSLVCLSLVQNRFRPAENEKTNPQCSSTKKQILSVRRRSL